MTFPGSLVSVPVIPPPPSEEQFAIALLQTFKRFTRSEFFEFYGTHAPPWNREKPIKRWFDSSVAGLPAGTRVNYRVFNQSAGAFQIVSMTAEEASSINLPGAMAYPKHHVLPTPARVLNTITGAVTPISPSYLCLTEEAQALAKELGDFTISEGRMEGPWTFQWNGDPRRMWNVISPSGNVFNAASLIALRNHAGVGAPGRWDKSGGEPVWISEIPTDTGEFDPRPEVPIPVRELLPQEVLAQTFGGIWVIRSASMFTPDNALREVLTLTRSIYLKLA